jgi:hypothetical protein
MALGCFVDVDGSDEVLLTKNGKISHATFDEVWSTYRRKRWPPRRTRTNPSLAGAASRTRPCAVSSLLRTAP